MSSHIRQQISQRSRLHWRCSSAGGVLWSANTPEDTETVSVFLNCVFYYKRPLFVLSFFCLPFLLSTFSLFALSPAQRPREVNGEYYLEQKLALHSSVLGAPTKSWHPLWLDHPHLRAPNQAGRRRWMGGEWGSGLAGKIVAHMCKMKNVLSLVLFLHKNKVSSCTPTNIYMFESASLCLIVFFFQEHPAGQQKVFTFYSLRSGGEYLVQVRCRPDHGFWSEWSDSAYIKVPDCKRSIDMSQS